MVDDHDGTTIGSNLSFSYVPLRPFLLLLLLRPQEKVDEEQRRRNRVEAEDRMKTIEALEWFPKALEVSWFFFNAPYAFDAPSNFLFYSHLSLTSFWHSRMLSLSKQFNQSLLNNALLVRTPDDPPPPRRSARAGKESGLAEPGEAEEGAAARKGKQHKQKQASSNGSYNWEDLPASYDLPPGLDRFTGANELLPPAPPSSSSDTSSKAVGRDVGGWVSPEFAKLLNRSWLERESPPHPFDLRSYAPQAGECVLYVARRRTSGSNHFSYPSDLTGNCLLLGFAGITLPGIENFFVCFLTSWGEGSATADGFRSGKERHPQETLVGYIDGLPVIGQRRLRMAPPIIQFCV